jgi:ribosomal protein S30
MFYVKTSTLPPRMHQKLTKHGKICKQNNQLPTKSHVELKDNSNIWPKVSQYQ